jgi:transcriptional regulator with PAS, ATPase and Fis domain
VAAIEKRKIEQTLRDMNGDRSRTADALQISYKVLLAKCRDYAIE